MSNLPLTILLVEDHAIVREALKSLINTQLGMLIVGVAGDGPVAIQLAGELTPDIVVMDVGLPGISGAQATRELRRISPNSRVVALTQYEDKSYVRELFDAGATGYVLKRSAADELVRAIRTVASGGTYFDPLISDKVASAFVRSPIPEEAIKIDLSEREISVLKLIAEGYTNKEIAHRLSIGVKSVETYKTRAMDKLHLSGRAELVRYALLRGWLQNP